MLEVVNGEVTKKIRVSVTKVCLYRFLGPQFPVSGESSCLLVQGVYFYDL